MGDSGGFLFLQGIQGGCTTPGHPGWIQVDSFQTIDTIFGSGFLLAGPVDRSATAIFNTVSLGKTIPTAKIIWLADGNKMFSIALSNVAVSSFENMGGRMTIVLVGQTSTNSNEGVIQHTSRRLR